MNIGIKPTIVKYFFMLVLSSCFARSEKHMDLRVDIESRIDESGERVNGLYLDGKKYGYWLTRYPDGCPKYERYYIADSLHGAFIAYHENGIISETGHYEMGSRNGVFKRYFSDGRVFYNGAYENDAKVGIWEYYIESNESFDYALCYRIQYKQGDTLVLYDAKLIPPLPNGEEEWSKW